MRMLRFSGSITGFLLGGWFMEACFSPQSIFFLQGLVPLVTMLPPLYMLEDPVVDGYRRGRRGGGRSRGSISSRQERGLSLGSIGGDDEYGGSTQRSLASDDGGSTRSDRPASVGAAAKAKLLQVWDCVQMNHIWMPMSFIFVFAATPSNADAFANYILGPLCFSDAMYTYLLAIGMAASLLGTFIYKGSPVPFQTLCHAGHRAASLRPSSSSSLGSIRLWAFLTLCSRSATR